MTKKALYSGLFLTGPSHGLAIIKAGECVQLHSRVIAHHLTLKFRPSWSEVVALPLGEEVSIRVVGLAFDERAHAMVCELPNELRAACNNKHPHITIAVAEGVKPVYSNELISKAMSYHASYDPEAECLFDFDRFAGYSKYDIPFSLPARVGFSDGVREYFEP